ncbi:MAG: asparagine synthetase B [Candidatus Diapherotrites archaeon]|nr:asparagine synthetase B [Candidatus Diapherotrites archaeon]
MCSIGGVYSKNGNDVFSLLLELIFSQKHRGSEGFGITYCGKTVKSEKLIDLQNSFIKGSYGICHSLLSVTGHQLQPLISPKNNFSLVHNGQIYNFKELSGKQLFNDSESIPLFISNNPKKNLENFMQKAVGNYAVGVCGKNSLLAFRDFLGIKPVWFGETSEVLAFASEAQALKKIGISFQKPLLPGNLVEFSKSGAREKKIFDLSDFQKTIPKKSSFKALFEAFQQSIEYRTSGLDRCGVFFSGGVDSSTIAKAVNEQVAETVLFTAGIAGSEDISFSDSVATKLGLNLVATEIQKDGLPFLCLQAMKCLGFFDLMQLGIAIPIFASAKAAKISGLKVVFSGQGSDEIFCGYSSYQKTLAQKSEKAVKEQVWGSLSEMWSRNLFREDIVSMHFSLEHRLPFLDADFLRQALALPLKEKIISPDDSLRKRAIRKIAQKIGVPQIAVERKKKAVQYGSGVQKELAKLFKH